VLYAGAVEQAGEEFVRTGQRAEAVEQLNGAFDSYSSHEALADARRVARLLRRLGVERRISSGERPKTGWNSLTQSELRVVHLIADGATNARVAEQLFLSPHTVKTHVRNALTKLGINSRAELRELMRSPSP
jgi:DNA-binding CsgD family transcriptional regulator